VNSGLNLLFLSRRTLAISAETIPFYWSMSFSIMLMPSLSFIIYFSFSVSIVEFFENNCCRTSLLFVYLNIYLTAYLFTWWCLSIIEFKSYWLWYFCTPNVYFMNSGSIPFFLAISWSFFDAFYSIGFSSTVLHLLKKSNGLFLLLFLLSALSIAAISTH
jgi:hypothetical protein